MEPVTTTLKYSIDEKFVFTKPSLEKLNSIPDKRATTDMFDICPIFNTQCRFAIYPNEAINDVGMFRIAMIVIKGDAIKIDVDGQYSISSATFTKKISQSIDKQNCFETSVDTTTNVFDADNKYFIGEELVLKVKVDFYLSITPRIKYPISTTWSIKEAELVALRTSRNGCLRSKRINVSSDTDLKYYLTFYPNGDINNPENVVVFIHLEFKDVQKVEADLYFIIDSAQSKNTISPVFERPCGMGLDVCSTEDLFDAEKSFITNGILKLKITGILLIEQKSQPTTLQLETGFASKKYLKHRGKEFTFVIGDKIIKVHKNVLLEASPVFTGMFESGLQEAIEKKMDLIDFEYDTVDAAIKLLYSCPIPTKFTFEKVLDVLRFADKYQIQRITDTVEDYLIERISSTNVCYIVNYVSSKANAPKLHSKCMDYLKDCMKTGKAVADLDTLDNDLAKKLFLEAFTNISETDNV